MFLDHEFALLRARQSFASGDLRGIMSEPSLNVQMIGLSRAVLEHFTLPAGQVLLILSIMAGMTSVSRTISTFCFLRVKRSSAIFHGSGNFYSARKSYVLLEV